MLASTMKTGLAMILALSITPGMASPPPQAQGRTFPQNDKQIINRIKRLLGTDVDPLRVARALADAGDPTSARIALDDIVRDTPKDHLDWIAVAETFAALGDRVAANKSLAQAASPSIQRTISIDDRLSRLIRISGAFRKLGDQAAAHGMVLRAADTIQNAGEKKQYLLSCVEQMSDTEDFDGALELADRLAKTDRWTLFEHLNIYDKNIDSVSVDKILKMLDDYKESNDKEYNRIDELINCLRIDCLIMIYKIGPPEKSDRSRDSSIKQAELALKRLKSPYYRGQCLFHLANLYASSHKMGEFARVKEMFGPDESHWKAEAVFAVSKAHLGSGDVAAASKAWGELLSADSSPEGKYEVLRRIAGLQQESGHAQASLKTLGEALVIARKIRSEVGDPHGQDLRLAQIAGALAKGGDTQTALQVAKTIRHEQFLADSLAIIACHQAEKRDVAAANVTLSMIPDPNPNQAMIGHMMTKAEAKASVSVILASRSETEAALRIIDSIENLEIKANALFWIAEQIKSRSNKLIN